MSGIVMSYRTDQNFL